jgi:hypothetical protein
MSFEYLGSTVTDCLGELKTDEIETRTEILTIPSIKIENKTLGRTLR